MWYRASIWPAISENCFMFSTVFGPPPSTYFHTDVPGATQDVFIPWGNTWVGWFAQVRQDVTVHQRVQVTARDHDSPRGRDRPAHGSRMC